MPLTCSWCQASFEHHPEDLQLYREHDFPAPEKCPSCRHKERSAHRNERTLYRRQCDLCHMPIVTIFSGDRPFPVYCPECWWGDKWNATSYGRDFDFSRPFFEQFYELQDAVPRLCLNNLKHENSEYCNQSVGNKNSYLLFGSDENEDSMYGIWINRCKDTFNCNNVADSRWCHDLIDSENCSECIYCQDLKNCRNCLFSFDLIGCQDCFGCAGLRNQQYHIYNQAYSKKEYQEKMRVIQIGSHELYEKMKQEFLKIRLRTPHKYAHILNSEDCSGDYISNSKNCHFCFDIFDAEACRYSFNLVHQHFNTVDVSYVTELQHAYQVTSGIGRDIYFSMVSLYDTDVWYSDLCFFAHDLFGCVGVKHDDHSILNKKYKPAEFSILHAKIITHMKKTGEWGKFFPVPNSLYGYNETPAQDFFPLTKPEVKAQGWRWKDPDHKEYQPQSYTIPDHIRDVSDDILEAVLSCADCGKNYRILASELKAYKNLSVPIPRKCPDCRYLERMKLRNPRILWERQCQNCGTAIQTSYAPERPEKVFCEKCYVKAMA